MGVLRDSRFFNIPTYVVKRADGKFIKVFERRPAVVVTSITAAISTGTNRLDILSYDTYKDATKFWAISDANISLNPFDILKESGTSVSIPSIGDVVTAIYQK